MDRTIEKVVSDIQAARQSGKDCKADQAILWSRIKDYVRTIANGFGAGDQTDDLVQESYFGVMNAVSRYDPAKGANFLTYATYHIRAVMLRYLECSGDTRLPAFMAERVRKYKKFCTDFQKAHGRKPNGIELKTVFGISLTPREWQEFVTRVTTAANMISSASLDAPLDEDGALTLCDLQMAPDDPEGEVIDSVFRRQLSDTIWRQVDALPEVQAGVIHDRYQGGLTLEQVGDKNGYTRERARMIEAKAMRKLRERESLDQLRPFYRELYGDALRGGLDSFISSWTSSTERVALRLLNKEKAFRGIREYGRKTDF